MKEIIVQYVKEGKFLKAKKSLKIGVEGERMYDMLVSESEDYLACFHDYNDKKYYLYSLISGKIIDSSQNEIECLGDYYYEKYSKEGNVTTELVVCKVDFENDKYEVVASNDSKQYYSNDKDMLAIYNPKLNSVCMINMNSNKKYEFTFKDLPNTEFLSIEISSNLDSESNFLVCVIFANNKYFNFFNINTNTFTFEKFFEGEVWDINEYDNKLYIITRNSELIDEKGNVLIASGYADIEFYHCMPYVYVKMENLRGIALLESGEVVIPPEYDEIIHNILKECAIVKKDKKYGLIDLETGKVIFEPEYDEIIYENNSFKAITKTYETYVKEKVK